MTRRERQPDGAVTELDADGRITDVLVDDETLARWEAERPPARARRGRADADILLEALRATGPDAYRCDPTRPGAWTAHCSACHSRLSDRRTLQITEPNDGGPVRLSCANGCGGPAIIRALEAVL